MPWIYSMEKFLRTGLLAGIFGLAILFFVFDPSEYEIFPRCIFYSFTGYYCPGCGSQRAVHNLLHLNFSGVISNNFLFLPAVALVIYHYSFGLVNRFFRLNLPNIFYLKYTPVAILVIIVVFWVLRNLPFYPFSVLAPNG